MDKNDLLNKEKEFIKLLEEGKSFEEAVQLLQVPSALIREWLLKRDTTLSNDISSHILEKTRLNAVPTTDLILLESLLKNISFKKVLFDTSTVGKALGSYITHIVNGQIETINNFANKLSEYLNDYYKYFSNPSEDTFHDNHLKSTLPFALKRLYLEGYQGITRVYINSIPVDTQWIFLTGENGYGKTTFLQAIAIGFLGHEEGGNVLVESLETRISIEFKNNGQNTIHNLRIPFQPITNLAAYGSARLEIQNAQSQSQVEKHMTTSYSLFNTDGVLQNIEFELYKWYLKGDKKFNAVKKLFKQLIPQLHDIKVDKDRDEVLYIEKDAHGKAFGAVPFRKLASGFRSIIAMIGDMVIRLYKGQPEITNPQKLSGIVLIDEFDLHLHPKWQRELPVLLSTAFPLVQFIVSTHSVIPFLGAPPNSVFLKVTRDRKKGIEVQKLDIDIKNLLPNTILTSAIFDMDNITQRNHEDLAAVRTEDNFNEVLENDQVREKLKQFEESDADFPTDLFNKA